MNGITVICPNSRRCVVKVTPSTQLCKVLEEACLKQGFDISAHELKHQNRRLDLALPLRLTGLPNNATVEIVPCARGNAPVEIQIALQLPDGTRLMGNFSNKTSLLDVLHEFSQRSAQNLVKCNNGQVPSCAYMNREYRGEAELKSTTLGAMGITGGRCLIRYSTVTMSPDELSKHEARLAEENVLKKKLEEVYETRKIENERRMQLEAERERAFERELQVKREVEARTQERTEQTSRDIERVPDSTPTNDNRSHNLPDPVSESGMQSAQASTRLQQLQSLLCQVNTSLNTNAVGFLGERLIGDDSQIHISDLQTTVSSGSDRNTGSISSSTASSSLSEALQQPAVVEKCDRMPVIIRQNSESCQNKTGNDIDDQFFELTVNDIQNIRKDLRAQAGLQEQRALLPKTYVAKKNKQLKEKSYQHTVVRFNFDDRTVLQAQFISKELVSSLYEFVAECVQNPGIKFDLYLINQKLPSVDAKNLIDVGVAPKSSLYIKFHSPNNAFDTQFLRSKFCEIPVAEADQLSKEWLSVNSIFEPYDPKVVTANDVRPNVKRQSKAAEEEGAGPSKVRQETSAAGVPKWFKKS